MLRPKTRGAGDVEASRLEEARNALQAAPTPSIVRPIERLDGQAEMLAHDLRRRTVDPRHFEPHAAPELRQSPDEDRSRAIDGVP